MLQSHNTIVAQNTNDDIYRQNGTIQGSNNLTTYFDDEFNYLYDPDLPLFVDAENGDYRLVLGSQAIDKGNNEYAYAAGLDENSLDIADYPRFVGGAIDIGAYEFDIPFNVSQSGVYRGSVTFQWTMVAKNAETMRLTWVSGTTTTVLGTFTAEGSLLWDTTQHLDAPGILKVEYLDDKNRVVAHGNYAATIINDPSIAIHCGEIAANEIWSKDKVHLVVGKLDVKNGVSLTIADSTVVKFWKSSYLNVDAGSTLNVQSNAVLTRAEDDEVAGDTNKDGNLSQPMIGTPYYRGNGTFNIDQTVDIKYLLQTRAGTLTANETWLGSQVYHLTGTVTVPSGVTLTIMPGAIIKFDKNCSLIVNTGGTLIAEGTAAQPIVFTSIKDDEYGGDTNGDGDLTRPQPGDWHQIYAHGGTVRMNYTRVYYGSNDGSGPGCLEVDNNGQFIFNNSILSFTKHCGIRSQSGSFNAYNSVITESPLAINLHGGTNNNFINCTIANVTSAVREYTIHKIHYATYSHPPSLGIALPIAVFVFKINSSMKKNFN